MALSKDPAEDPAGVARARRGAWCAAGISSAMALVVLYGVGLSLSPSALPLGAALLALAAIHVAYTRYRPEPILGPLTGALTIVLWTGIAGGVLGLAALRAGAPLVDPALARADAAFGLDTRLMVRWVADGPSWIVSVLKAAYEGWLPLLLATLAALALLRREDRIWELCLAFAGTITLCTTASAFMPAIGAFAFFGTAPDILARLPAGAGLYHLPVFEAYRSGIVGTVDVWQLEGVVTFPSFHVCLALLQAYALRGIRIVAWPNYLWGAIVIVSTVPIGGHYVVDLVAGAAIWAVVAASAGALARGSVGTSKPGLGTPMIPGRLPA